MKVTTVRFSDDLWAAISAEAALAGVSASQFIREAALARAAAAAGARGEVVFDSMSATIDEVERVAPLLPDAQRAEVRAALMRLSRALAGSTRESAEALRAESRQARHVSEQQQARAQATRSD